MEVGKVSLGVINAHITHKPQYPAVEGAK